MKNSYRKSSIRSQGITAANDARESMSILPRILQPVLTAITGKPLPGEQPVVHWSPIGRSVAVLAVLLVSLVSGAILMALGGAWVLLLPISWLITVYATRSIQSTIIHHGSHGTLIKNEWLMSLVGEMLSTAIWIMSYADYTRTHRKHHTETATDADVDLVFLKDLGLRPGESASGTAARVFRTILSPRFHWRYFRARIAANFLMPSWPRILLATSYTLSLLALTSGHWVALTLVFLIPVFPLYHIAGFLQLLTEHNWVRIGERVNSRKVILTRLTTARFMGESAPQISPTTFGGAMAWVGWTLRMLFLHVPARLFVVQGDLTAHDFHHNRAGSPEWSNASFARQKEVDRGIAPYHEIWGLGSAIAETVELLSCLPANAKLGQPLTYGEIAEIYLTM